MKIQHKCNVNITKTLIFLFLTLQQKVWYLQYFLCPLALEFNHKFCIWSLFTKSTYEFPPGCILFFLRYSKVRAFTRQSKRQEGNK